MRRAYNYTQTEDPGVAAVTYYLERVPNGKILVVNTLIAYMPTVNADDRLDFFVEDAGRKVYLFTALHASTGCITMPFREALVGEGDRLGVDMDLAHDPAYMIICVTGVLWDMKDWQEAYNCS